MRNYKEIPADRLAKIKTLIYYVCAHRVKTYYGTLEHYMEATSTLKRWRRYTRERKGTYKNSWAKIAEERRRYNACLSIPTGLIRDILGYHTVDGIKRRYSPS